MAEHKPSADPTQALGGAGVLGKGTLSRQLVLATTALPTRIRATMPMTVTMSRACRLQRLLIAGL